MRRDARDAGGVRVHHGRDREGISTDADRAQAARNLIGTEARREATLRSLVGLPAEAGLSALGHAEAQGEAQDEGGDGHDSGTETLEALAHAAHAARRAGGRRRPPAAAPTTQAPLTSARDRTETANTAEDAITDDDATMADEDGTATTDDAATTTTTNKPIASTTTTKAADAATGEGDEGAREAACTGKPEHAGNASASSGAPRPQGTGARHATGATGATGAGAMDVEGEAAGTAAARPPAGRAPDLARDGGAGHAGAATPDRADGWQSRPSATGRPLSASSRSRATTPAATTSDYADTRADTRVDAHNNDRIDADATRTRGAPAREPTAPTPRHLEIRVETTRAGRTRHHGRHERRPRRGGLTARRTLSAHARAARLGGVPAAAGARHGVAAAGGGSSLAVALPLTAVCVALVATFFMLLTLLAGGIADDDRARGAAMVADVAAEAYRVGAERGDYHWKGQAFRDYVGGTSGAWDAAFCSWCLGQAGFVESGLVGRYASVDSFLARFEHDPSAGEVHGPDDLAYVPEAGDLVVRPFGTPEARIGVVTEVSADGSHVTFVSGDAAGGEAGSYDRDADGYGGYVAAGEMQAHDGATAYIHPGYSADAVSAHD